MDVLWRDREPGRGGEQPPPGGARRPTRARRRRRSRCGTRCSSSGATSTSTGSSTPPPTRAGSRRPRRTAPPSRSTAASCCPRTATTTGRKHGATSSPRSRRSSRRRPPRSAPRSALARCPADASSFVGRGARARGAAASLLGADAAAHPRRHGRRGQDAARARARARRRSRPTRRARLSSSSRPSATRGSSPDAVAAALDLRALPAQELVDALVDVPRRRARCSSCSTTASTCSRGGATLADTLLRAAPQLDDRRDEPRAAARAGRGRLPRAVARHPRIRSEPLAAAPAAASTRRSRSSSSARRPPRRASCSTRRTPRTSPASAFRLDGLPLALELAAGRLGALSAAAIAERLDDRFRLLRTGSHAAPTRQQTLTATLQWSHDLLEPDERAALPPARDLRRRLRARRRRASLRAATGSSARDDRRRARAARREVARRRRGRADAGGATACSRRCACTRASELVEAGEERGGSPTGTPSWALELAEREHGLAAARPRGGEPARGARRRCSRARRTTRSRLCVALLPFWLRRIELERGEAALRRGARRRARSARRSAPRRCSPRRRSTSAAARSRPALRSPSRVAPSPSRSATREREWRALQFLGEFGVASDAVDVAVAVARARARARAPRAASRPPRRSASTRSASRTGSSATSPSADELVAESIERFRALAGSPETIPVAAQHRRDPDDRPGGRPGSRHVFEDTLQPFVEISCEAAVGYALANQAAIARARGDLARARALLDESDSALRGASATTRGVATVLVRRAYIELAEGDVADARAQLERALELRARLGDRRGVGLVLSGLGLVEHDGRRLRRARSAISPRRATSSGAPATAGVSRARSGGPPTSRSRADDLDEARGGARGGALGARGDAARALDREHARGARRGRARSAATPSVPRRCSPMRAHATPRATTRSASRASTSGFARSLRRR